MEKINDTNLISSIEKNEKNDFSENEEEESLEEEWEPEVVEKKHKTDQKVPTKIIVEHTKDKITSNLEFLLSQNDILPLLKKLNKDKVQLNEKINMEKIAKNRNGISGGESSSAKNARLLNKNIENENDDFEEEFDFIKLESQPENLKNGNLKEYQLEALNWLLKLHYMNVNGILADEMGLGKTIQTISLIAYMNLPHIFEHKIFHLIIVPKVTINNWQREIKKWLPEIKILYFYGNKEERKYLVDVSLKAKDYDIVLTTFECAMKEKCALMKIKFEYIIIDEAHRLKNEKAKFSSIIRQFNSNHRLLLTGTPLQNNLHELWALLNFLMPNIFNDSEEFDEIFDLNSANEEDQQKIVKQIHMILRPFVLRRLKSEVEFKLPSKKEIYLYVGLSELQKKMYKQILTKNIDIVNGVTKDKIQLLNILMQLKKVCNHPYLFPKVEKGPPFIEGEHLIDNSMKLKIMDVLLKRIYNDKNKVLIFSQMTTLLNILDDYCRYRGYSYCRIDGSTSSEDRDKRIEDFQSPNSDKFIFLLSTRAGGLGINLHSANVVILYDSDWNPQVDLQAIDRAHRIGQIKPVTVYRFVTEGTVEEKIVERAAKKLKIDHLIIQRGKPIQNKVSALEMTNIIQYGADKLFAHNESDTIRDIEEILDYSINKTEKINSHLKDLEEKLSINNLSLNSDNKDIYQFEGEDYKKKYFQDETSSALPILQNISLSLGQRERKLINGNLEEKSKKLEYKKPKQLTGWRAKVGGGYTHQFWDIEELDDLDDKENSWKDYLKRREEKTFNEDEEEIPEKFSQEDENLRNKLLNNKYSKWTKKDFAKFLRASEIYGLNDNNNIAKFMRTKTSEEVDDYSKTFQKRIDELPNGPRIMTRLNKFESEKNKIIEYQEILENYFNELSDNYEDIFSNVEIPYKKKSKGNNANNANSSAIQSDIFTEEEDKYFICLMFKYGYRSWNLIKNHILHDPMMKFNLNMKVKTDHELLERANFLINCLKIEKSKKKSKKSNGDKNNILIEKKNEKKISNKKKKKMKKKKTK